MKIHWIYGNAHLNNDQINFFNGSDNVVLGIGSIINHSIIGKLKVHTIKLMKSCVYVILNDIEERQGLNESN